MNNQYKQAGITEFGSTNQLHARVIAQPELASHQVWIRVLASSINPIDIKTRSGLGYVAQAKQTGDFLPLGYDVFGIVEQVGDCVSHIKPGEAVLGMVGFPANPGCYASHVVASAEEIIVVDKKVSLDMAGLCLAGLTAVQALEKLSPNLGTLFVNAPTGGVGHLAVQIAKRSGFDVVAITTRRDLVETLDLAVPAMSYEDFFAEKRRGQLLDLVGGKVAKDMLGNLQAGGLFVTVPTVTKDEIIDHAKTFGIQGEGVLVAMNCQQLNALYQAVIDKQLKVVASKRYSLEEISEAHTFVEQGQHFGKVIIVA
ncbi:NADP-dependent oxidoreductase [Pseudoalteromonas luteoviolacea]|uniref:NADP-dependent oxidoreductase n=1 Tax=Pseudoalteromonas luteoviolacea TaxID=43657 RepID=UPI00114D975A|nr:NADP-dependent oxidoreductase [Pseudoalteromonas luteoviolacea]TQF71681.1 NADP-dependent oxidoreductase [Pseudoalteromonas luteoviolacea]